VRIVAAVGLLTACAAAVGCGGGDAKRTPTQRDIAVMGAAVSDVVYQCQAAAAGYIAGPDRAAVTRDVARLAGLAVDVEPDARFRFAGRAQETTLRAQVQQAARSLRADCAPEQARRLDDALR
jgi:hypothetical protein